MEPSVLRLPAADGLTLNALEWSNEGVPMLLIHGFGNEAHIWDDFAPVVAPHYRVIAIDLRGHGRSDWHPAAAYDYEDHVRDLEAVMDHLGFERVVLVSHSLGGRISMLYGGRHPEKLAGLVIVDSAPEIDKRGSLRISMDVAEHKDPSFDSVSEYEQMLMHAYPAATSQALKRMAKHGLKQRDDGRYVLTMDAALRSAVAGGGMSKQEIEAMHAHREQEMWQALEKIQCPTLVVRGAASDILSPDVADRMADEVLANGKLAVIPQAGHSVMTDNPQGFGTAVGAFVLGE
jgi:pimeloyl-ACP methyl ester carboxylesterase